MERLEHVAGSQGPQGKQGTNTQEIEHGRSADQVATGWPGPGGASANVPRLYIYLFLSLFVRLFVALFVCIVL